MRQEARLGRWQLKGTYYGEGVPAPEELETPEGRQRMRTAIASVLEAADAAGSSQGFPERVRDDLAVFDEN